MNLDWQVVEPQQFPSFGQEMKSWKAGAVDCETTGTNVYLGAKTLGIGLSPFDSEKHYYLPVKDLNPLDLRPILEPLEHMILLNHNIKFDLHVLSSLGWDGHQDSFIDTIVMARIWAKEEHPQLGLKELGFRIFGYEYSDPEVAKAAKTGKLDKFSPERAGRYCCEDLWLVKKLYRWLKENLSPELLRLFVKETYLTRDLFDMERRGIMVDEGYLAFANERLQDHMGSLLEQIQEASFPEFNPRSPPQTKELMKILGIQPVKMTDKNEPSWDREACLAVRGQHPVALKLAKYRALGYQASGMIERAMDYVALGSPLHGEFKNWGTVSGRLSGDLQQMPDGWLQFGEVDGSGEDVLVWEDDDKAKMKEFSIRRLFRPRPGFVLLKADYKQIEMFILGDYMQDPTFSRWLDSGNVHAAVALEIWGDAALYYDRGKTYNFATVFGQGDKARAKQLNCTLKQSQQYRDEYNARMPGYQRFLRRVRRLLERDGTISNIYGRQYSVDPDRAYVGVNRLVQGSAGDFVKFKLPETRKLRQQIGIEMIITTHDDFVAEVPEEEIHRLPEWLAELPKSPFGRPLELDIDFSRESLVQLHPLEELMNVAS